MPVTSKMPSFVLEPEDTPFTFNVNDTKQRKVFPLAKLEPVNVWYYGLIHALMYQNC